MIQSGRNPFEVSILSACLLYGLTALFAYNEVSGTAIRAFGPLGGRMFVGLLAVGAALALFGIILHSVLGLFYERAGLIVVTGTCAAYGVVAIGQLGPRGIGFALLMAAFAVASGLRLLQIRVGRRRARERAGGAA